MNKVILLTDEQTFGSKKIDVIEKLGTKCAISDFAILLGAIIDDKYHVDDDNSLKGRTGRWYLSSSNCGGDIREVKLDGDRGWIRAGTRSSCIRPVLLFSNFSIISSNIVRGKSECSEFEYGEYPQYAVDSRLGRILEDEFSNGKLKKTGNTYVTDSRKWIDNSYSFSPIKHIEFEYNGKKYVRIKSNSDFGYKLSNGVRVMQNDIVWLEVSPITWHVIKGSNMLISKTLLVSGIRFCDNGKYKDNFKKTEMYMFLNKYFVKDIIPNKLQIEEKTVIKSDNKFIFEKLIEEIYEYCKDLTGGDKIIKRLDDIIKEYNDGVVELRELKENNIPTFVSLSGLNKNLELKLRLILDDLKSHHEKYKVYYDMLNVINEYVGVMNGFEDEKNYELSDDLNIIINVCIPYLIEKDGNSLKIELMTILNGIKEEIIQFLHNNNIFDNQIDDYKLKYNSIDEMNLEIRKRIHPLLINLCSSVRKRNIELEIKDFIHKAINGLYTEPKNKFLSFYLDEINKTYIHIVSLMEKLPKELQKEYKEKLMIIIDFKIDYDKDFNSITKNLIEIWLRLNKVLYNIEKYLNEIEELDNSYINVSKIIHIKR